MNENMNKNGNDTIIHYPAKGLSDLIWRHCCFGGAKFGRTLEFTKFWDSDNRTQSIYCRRSDAFAGGYDKVRFRPAGNNPRIIRVKQTAVNKEQEQ